MTEHSLHLVAHLAGRGILFAASQVESVVDITDIVPAPGAAAAVRGLAALRSRVVTVLDTWLVLGLPTPTLKVPRGVITAVDGQLYAVLVDSLEDVAPFAVRPLASGLALGDRWADVATGTAERDGEPMLIVDLPKLVAAVA